MDSIPFAGEPGLAQAEFRHLVLAAQREGNKELARLLAVIGVSPSQSELLRVIGEFGPLSLKRLGALIICESGSPSRLVDTLVARGFVNRKPAQDDKRSVVLQLTDEGSSLLEQISQAENILDSHIDSFFTATEKTVMATALRRFLSDTPSGEAIHGRFATRRQVIK